MLNLILAAAAVPDSGTTVSLLGIALSGLMFFAQSSNSGSPSVVHFASATTCVV